MMLGRVPGWFSPLLTKTANISSKICSGGFSDMTLDTSVQIFCNEGAANRGRHLGLWWNMENVGQKTTGTSQNEAQCTWVLSLQGHHSNLNLGAVRAVIIWIAGVITKYDIGCHYYVRRGVTGRQFSHLVSLLPLEQATCFLEQITRMSGGGASINL